MNFCLLSLSRASTKSRFHFYDGYDDDEDDGDVKILLK